MERIDWARRSGEEVETVVGILLARRYGPVERITASQGDGGLDVIKRESDGWAVWQVKNYDTQPSSGQRAKIERSLKRAVAFAAEGEIRIKSWTLVAPVSPTTQSLKWFTGLTESYDFTSSWLGSDFLDGLASEFPDVIDYYFANGKDRLATALAQFASVVGVGVRSGGDVKPADVLASLTSAHDLVNKLDPHFRYDFSVDTKPPELVEAPGLVFASTTGNDDRHVTVRLFEKYEGALEGRPITGRGEFHTPDDETRQAVRDFLDYGAPLELPHGSATMEADLPGGLDGSLRSGSIQIWPIAATVDDWTVIRYRISDVDNADIATLKLRVPPATSGVGGRNKLAVATECLAEVFSVEQRYTDETNIMRLSFALNDLSGKIPEAVLPGLRFLNELRQGRSLQWGNELGPIKGPKHAISRDICHLAGGGLLSLVEALVEIQELTDQQLRIPDLSLLTNEAGNEIIRAARLLRGESLTVHVPQLRVISNGTPWPDGHNAVMLVLDHNVSIGESIVSIGQVVFHAPAASVRTVCEGDGPRTMYVEPLPDEDLLRGHLRMADDD